MNAQGLLFKQGESNMASASFPTTPFHSELFLKFRSACFLWAQSVISECEG